MKRLTRKEREEERRKRQGMHEIDGVKELLTEQRKNQQREFMRRRFPNGMSHECLMKLVRQRVWASARVVERRTYCPHTGKLLRREKVDEPLDAETLAYFLSRSSG